MVLSLLACFPLATQRIVWLLFRTFLPSIAAFVINIIGIFLVRKLNTREEIETCARACALWRTCEWKWHAIEAPLVVFGRNSTLLSYFNVLSLFPLRSTIKPLHWIRIYRVFACADCLLPHLSSLIPTVSVWRIFGEITFQYPMVLYVGFGVPLNETHINKGRFREKREKVLFVACKYVFIWWFRVRLIRFATNKYCEWEKELNISFWSLFHKVCFCNRFS